MDASSFTRLSSQRVNGVGGIAVQFRDGRSRIRMLYQEGASKIRMPQVAAYPLEAILINMAGGLTGGDRLTWDIELDPGASAVFTTQACERIYRAGAGEATISTRIRCANGTRLAWLPQETIVFDRSRLTRSLDVDLEHGAEVLLVEATVFGRLAMGETVEQARFSDRWRVRLGGRLVHAEEFRIGPDAGTELKAAPVTDGNLAVATVLQVSSRDDCALEAVRRIVGDDGAASFWQVGGGSKLLVRLHAPDSYALRKRLAPLLALLNGQAGLPKVWSI